MIIEQSRTLVKETAVGSGIAVLVSAPRSSHGRAAAASVARALRQMGA